MIYILHSGIQPVASLKGCAPRPRPCFRDTLQCAYYTPLLDPSPCLDLMLLALHVYVMQAVVTAAILAHYR